MHQKILILDFGSQVTQLIARRVREAHVFCEVHVCDVSDQWIRDYARDGSLRGIILSGSHASVYEDTTDKAPAAVFELGLPVLGICYGMQTMAHQLGGKVEGGHKREFGPAAVRARGHTALLAGINDFSTEQGHGMLNVWMSHGDKVTELPPGFKLMASTESCPIAAMADETRRFYALQFHPEVTHTRQGSAILRRFVLEICAARPDWVMGDYIAEAVDSIRRQVGDEEVILGLSGGVDSSVAAALIHRAIGEQLTCVFVDHGLLRLNEGELVMDMFVGKLHARVIRVDAAQQFLQALAGVADPEAKRKIIGREFVEVFKAQAARLKAGTAEGHPRAAAVEAAAGAQVVGSEAGALSLKGDGPGCAREGQPGFRSVKDTTGESRVVKGATWLAQGTIYPDVIESGGAHSKKAVSIKSHHNVGGLPQELGLKLLEPLRELFKDEVRELGVALGLPSDMVYRHPFPGPGLGVRILGEIRREYADLLRRADAIFIEELRNCVDPASGKSWYDLTAQAFAVFLPVRSVGVMGDGRTYDFVVALRAVQTTDFMTADWAELPYALLKKVSSRIINEVHGINRVTYDISSKPPATIEWE